MVASNMSSIDFPSNTRMQAWLTGSAQRAEFEYRRQEARIVNEVWQGRFDVHVTQKLRNRFHPKTFEKLQLDQGIKTSNRIDRDVIKKIATALGEGSNYWLTDPNGHEFDSDEFVDLMRAADFDNLGKRLDELTELHRRVLVMPTVAMRQREGIRKLQFNIYTPENFDLVADPDNKQEWLAAVFYDDVLIRVPGKLDVVKRMRATWIDQLEWVQYVSNDRGGWDEMPGSRRPNIYGLVPGVLFGNGRPVDGFWLDCLGPILAQITIDTCAWETFLDLMASSQVKVLVGPLNGNGFASGQVLRPAGAVDTGTATSGFGVYDFQTDMRQFTETKITRPREMAAVMAGLRADEFATNHERLSGEALKILNFNRDRYAQHKRSFLVESFRDLYRVMWWVLFVEMKRPDAPPIAGITALPPGSPPHQHTLDEEIVEEFEGGEDFEFHMDPKEVSYPELQAERVQRIQFEMALGLTSPVDEYLIDNPDATVSQAWLQVEKNLAVSALLQNKGRVKAELLAMGVTLNPNMEGIEDAGAQLAALAAAGPIGELAAAKGKVEPIVQGETGDADKSTDKSDISGGKIPFDKLPTDKLPGPSSLQSDATK